MLPDEAIAEPLVAGTASGRAVVLDEPLSLWGGLDPATGMITDVHHPQRGHNLSGRIVVMTAGRGSSSASSVLAEAVRRGKAPAAFILTSPDEILVLGSIVGAELYDIVTPIVVLDPTVHRQICTDQPISIDASGAVSFG